MELFVTWIWRLSRLMGIISAALLLAAVSAVCHLVFVRYVLNESAIWQHEFVTFSVIGATLLGSPYVLLHRGHVNVDLLPLYLGKRSKMALALFASGASFLFCAVLTYYGYTFWHESWANDWRAETVWAPPLWVPYASIPLGFGLTALQYLADILALLTGRDQPFAAARLEVEDALVETGVAPESPEAGESRG
ncbi:MAG: TRAP transporter small permease [Rhodovibrionaceae bacterium]|nr:TRAP transporter small permease [Rhodovibrionaceae bacterium]